MKSIARMKCQRKTIFKTGNHYKWDWPKILCPIFQAMFVDCTILRLWMFIYSKRYRIIFLQILEIWTYSMLSLPCRIPQNSAIVPQNVAKHVCKNHIVRRNSAGAAESLSIFLRLNGNHDSGDVSLFTCMTCFLISLQRAYYLYESHVRWAYCPLIKCECSPRCSIYPYNGCEIRLDNQSVYYHTSQNATRDIHTIHKWEKDQI